MSVIQTWGEEVESEVPQTEVEAVEAFESAFDDGDDLEPETEADSDEPADPPSDENLEASEPEPEPEPKPTQVINTDRGRDDLLIQIWNAELRCRGTEAFIEDLKEQLKDAKDAHEKAIENLRELASKTHHPMPLFDQPPKSENVEQPGEAESIDTDEPEDNSWRDRDFIEFIKSKEIGGLGPKKIEALSEIVKTFGDFQDLRERASLEHVHLSKLLPDGFGPKVTDEIDNAFLDFQWKDSTGNGAVDLPEVEDDPGFKDDPEAGDDSDFESKPNFKKNFRIPDIEPDPIDYESNDESSEEKEAEPVASQVNASSFDLTDDIDSL